MKGRIVTEKLSWFSDMCPLGPISGTYLHDEQLEMIHNPFAKNGHVCEGRNIRSGDLIGYYGMSGWWFVFDQMTCLKVEGKEEQKAISLCTSLEEAVRVIEKLRN